MFRAYRLAVLLPAVLVLAGCVVGVPTAPTLVTGGSAALNAEIVATEPSAVSSWFEYGTTTAYGRSTPEKRFSASAGTTYPVYALVPHLAADTAYHLRVCLRETGDAPASCSADASFATTPPQDSVVARSQLRDAAGVNHPAAGIDLFATSHRDGTGASGSAFYGGTFGGSTSDVTCVRVEGDRATVGTARNVFVFVDLGDAGGDDAGRDLLSVLPAAADPSVCPPPVAEPNASFFDAPGVMITDAP